MPLPTLSPEQRAAALEKAAEIRKARAELKEQLKAGKTTLTKVLDRAEAGADRLVNALAAREEFGGPAIVIDLGTSTNFDVLSADGAYIGGAIAPGLVTAADNLVRRAAKLPATELTAPARAIGKRTEDCIRAGVLFGAADAADGMVRRIKAEWPGGSTPYVVATGGLVSLRPVLVH